MELLKVNDVRKTYAVNEESPNFKIVIGPIRYGIQSTGNGTNIQKKGLPRL